MSLEQLEKNRMNPNQDKMWWLALDNLEQEWVAKLEGLLGQNRLEQYLNQAVETTWEYRQQLRDQKPPKPEAEIDELSLPLLAPSNPDLDRDNPPQLSPHYRQLLNQFRSQHEQSPINPKPMIPMPKIISSGKKTSSRRPAKSARSGRTSKR
jgi:hypothetical protein